MHFIMIFIVAFFPALVFADNFDSEMVRVRLKTTDKKIELSGFSISVQGEEKSFLPVALPSAFSRLIITFERKGKKDFWQVLRSEEKIARIYADKYLYIKGQNMRLGTAPMPLRIVLSAARKIDVVGLISMRDYLYGVLAKEMPAHWPVEALKAQAVAARSYARAMMRERKGLSYDVESNIFDQVFDQSQADSISRAETSRIKDAVNETADQVLLGRRKEVVKAFYHADCGGQTSSSASVFGVSGLAGGVLCPGRPNSHWLVSMNEDELVGKIMPAGVKLAGIDLQRLGANERVESVKLKFSDGSMQIFSPQKLRAMFGFQRLRSAFFRVERQKGLLIFSGQGFGHGVGMCQWGSKILASQGALFPEILKRYYPEKSLGSSYLSPLPALAAEAAAL
jgi:stage II sporulation protein D